MGTGAGSRGEVSGRIQALRFPLACVVVWIHAHEPSVHFSGGSSPLVLPWGYRWLLETLFDDMARVAVPLYFVFSGYLLFLRSSEAGWTWGNAVQQRLSRMLPPYLFWNTLFFSVQQLGRWMPVTRAYFRDRGPVEGTSPVWSWIDPWLGLTGHPADVPLWYLRDLAFLLLLSGVIGGCLRWLRGPAALLYFVAVLVLEFACQPLHSRLPSDLFWFSCGCWCGLNGTIPDLTGSWRRFMTGVWLVASVWRGYGLLNSSMWRMAWLTVPLGVWVAWSWSADLRRYPRLREQWQRLAAPSFFLFAAHVLPLVALRKLAWRSLESGGSLPSLLGLYGVIPGIVVLGCLGLHRGIARLPWRCQKWIDPTVNHPKASVRPA